MVLEAGMSHSMVLQLLSIWLHHNMAENITWRDRTSTCSAQVTLPLLIESQLPTGGPYPNDLI